MKNITNYRPKKYDELREVEKNIFVTLEPKDEEELKLKKVNKKLLKFILNMSKKWSKGTEDLEKDYYVLTHKGVKYYKIDLSSKDVFIEKDTKVEIYVSSLMFEFEEEFDEKVSEDGEMPQYPIEDILENFGCWCLDFYPEENKNDSVNSYVELASYDIESMRRIQNEIIGKHVYDKKEDNHIRLVVE